MNLNETCFVTGYSKDKFMIMELELNKTNYLCKTIYCFKGMDKILIHSLEDLDESIYLIDSFNDKLYKYNKERTLLEIAVGRDPRHMCFDEKNIYVTNFESDSISIIDLETFSLTGSIPTGIKPHDISCNSGILYVTCYEENKILEYNLENEYNRYFTTSGKPMHISVMEDIIIVMTYSLDDKIDTKVNFINKTTGMIEDIIEIEELCSNFDIDKKNNQLYITNIVDKSLYIIDINNRIIEKTIFLGGYPEDISHSEKNIYVTNSKKNQIIVVDKKTKQVSANIDLEFIPECIKII